MKSLKLSIIFLSFFCISFAQDLSFKGMNVDHKINPVGIDNKQPRFSWKIKGTGNNIMQTAYLLRVASDEKFSSIVWQSSKVETSESILQTYRGPELKSGQKYFWQVKIWDNKGTESKWSQPAFWEMGLLSPSEWKAKWIEKEGDTLRYSPSTLFRKEFQLTCQLKLFSEKG